MLSVENSDITTQTSAIEKAYLSGATAPLYFDKFLEKTMTKLAEKEVFPRTVNIPKSMDRLLKGDFEPERTFVVNECPTYMGRFPIWFGNSTNGITLRGAGYRNGDSRYPCTFALDDMIPHGILGGATGQGKSVTLNAVVTGVMMEYPPWEVSLALLDAKVVSFARYAGLGTFPHIRSIGATTDSGYILSVLETLYQEMMLRNAIFAIIGVENIIDFRKETGLAIPRVFIPADEVQTMFKTAGNKAKRLIELFDLFGRLGRSTGMHILLSSQEPSAVPNETLNNVLGRMALGCQPPVSTKLIGNDAAKVNLGIKGRLIINKNSSNGDKKDNIEYTVPYQTGAMFKEQKEFLGKIGDDMEFRYPLSYYNQDFKIEMSELESKLTPWVKTNKKIILGEPSYVLNTESSFVELDMSGKEIENIFICGNTYNNVIRHMYQLKTNFKLMGRSVINNVFYADLDAVEKSGLKEIAGVIEEFRDFDNATVQFYFMNVYRRLICLKVDDFIFSGQPCKTSLDDLFYKSFEKGSEQDTELNRKRNFALHGYLGKPEFSVPFGLTGVAGDKLTEMKCHIVKDLIHLYTNLGLGSDRMVYDKLPPVYNWIVAPEKILGLGRTSKSKNIGVLEKFMMDSARANVRFIICGLSFDEVSAIAMMSRFNILDTIDGSVSRKFKVEDFPESTPPMLAILYDRFADVKECKKFKKLAYDGEIFV